MEKKRSHLPGYLLRFTLTHVGTYLVFGLLFMVISGYFEYFSSHDLLKDFMRPADSPIVRLAVPIQFIRGALIAAALYPFRSIIIGSRLGWLKLFGVLWVLTDIGAVITGPGSIEGFIYTRLGFGNPLIGLPEVIIQMLVFSYIFCKWEKNSALRKDEQDE
jgi:hypothetical protein